MNKQPIKGEYLEIILRSPRTIFTVMDAALMWGETSAHTVTSRLYKYEKAGKLVRVCRGIYAKDAAYDRIELASRIYVPSYISFETVLARDGLIFQYYDRIFVATYVTRDIEVSGQKISFVRMKDSMRYNSAGIEHSKEYSYSIASKERAFLDRIYVSKEYHFDYMDVLDWNKVFEILPLYQNKRMECVVRKYFKYTESTKI